VIRVAGDTLTFRAFTATGQLYDAFRLIKQEGRPNRFVDLGPSGAVTYTHANTPAYRW
jgi:hypothetical protein